MMIRIRSGHAVQQGTAVRWSLMNGQGGEGCGSVREIKAALMGIINFASDHRCDHLVLYLHRGKCQVSTSFTHKYE